MAFTTKIPNLPIMTLTFKLSPQQEALEGPCIVEAIRIISICLGIKPPPPQKKTPKNQAR